MRTNSRTVTEGDSGSRRRGVFVRLAILASLLSVAVLAAKWAGLFALSDRAELGAFIDRLQNVPGAAGWFVLLYAVIAGFGLPATPLTLAGGAVFGTVIGSALNWTGATLGAVLAHQLARRLGSDGIRVLLGRKADGFERFSAKLDFPAMLRLRLIPVMPFNLLNFAAGIARVPIMMFIGATALGILPGTIIFTFFADSVIGGVAGAQSNALVRVFVAGVLLTLLSFAPKLFRGSKPTAVAALIAVGAITSVPRPATALVTYQQQNVFQRSAFDGLLPKPNVFDHSAFDGLLRKHVVDGLVDYDAFKKAPEFRGYLEALAKANPTQLDRAERLAFWINAYNAYTIELINKHGERKSIRNINKTFGLVSIKGPWQERIANVGGTVYTLLHIEDKIIREQFKYPRIHFAIVCASLGCPRLRSESYSGARLNAQLDDQARDFLVRSPEKNRVDVASRTAYLSPIFSWYRGDFGGSEAAVGQFIATFLPPGPERELLNSGRFTVRETSYDWSLNGR